MFWQTMESAPKGGGAEMVTDPNWVDPPQVLLLFADGEAAVCRWDWYYAEGGLGYRGTSAWVDRVSGELVAFCYDEPIRWAHIPPLEETN